jgi:hypothetical protein
MPENDPKSAFELWYKLKAKKIPTRNLLVCLPGLAVLAKAGLRI